MEQVTLAVREGRTDQRASSMVSHVYGKIPYYEWVAPEVIHFKNRQSNESWRLASDVFSFGRTMFELLSGNKPFSMLNDLGGDMVQVEAKVLDGTPAGKLPHNCPKALEDLMNDCCKVML